MVSGDQQSSAPAKDADSQQQQVAGDVLASRRRINIILETKPENLLKLEARFYQTELCEKALAGNVIIYLGTGLGKTYIVILFLRSPQIATQVRLGNKVVFLAPTQDLTRQQAEYMHMHLPYRIKVYCGRTCDLGNHIDHWKREDWDKQFKEIDILVMTPQIFSSALGSNLIEFPRVSAIIMDECHHAVTMKSKVSGHPYAKIMDNYAYFYRQNPGAKKPHIVGLTASLVNLMPKDPGDVLKGIVKLEQKLDAVCVTNLEVQESRPKMVIHIFNDVELGQYNDSFCDRLVHFKTALDSVLNLNKIKKLEYKLSSKLDKEEVMMLTYYNRLKLSAMGISIKPSSFPKVIESLLGIRCKTGLWCFQSMCSRLVERLQKNTTSSLISADVRVVYANFVRFLQWMASTAADFIRGDDVSQLLTFTQPKLLALLDILKDEHRRVEDGSSGKTCFSCIVFVHSRLEVLALDGWLKMVSGHIPEYQFIKSDYAVGLAASSSSKYACLFERKSTEQARVLKEFRDRKLNVLVTTSVLEEGIDLPVCSTVIRYDAAATFRVYVQSRGRAREKISSFITMSERRKREETTQQLTMLNDFEERVKTVFTQGRDIATASRQAETVIKPQLNPGEETLPIADTMFRSDFFATPDGRIYLSASNARILLHMYQSRITNRHPYTDGIRYDCIRPNADLYQVTIYMPPGCPIQQGIQGNLKGTSELAEDSAIVAAYRTLFEAGLFDEYGVPMRITPEKLDELLASVELLPKTEELNPYYAGRLIEENGRELVEFESMMHRPSDSLYKRYLDKTYKLIKLKFVPIEGKVRQDTRSYFEKNHLGLIIDASMSLMVPPTLYSHYGDFRLECEEISSDFKIRSQKDHYELSAFTHKILANCLCIGRISLEAFRMNCLTYITVLNSSNRPDLDAMLEAFPRQYNYRLRRNDIVKVRYHLDQQEEDRLQRNRLYLVREVRDDLNPYSLIPGTTRMTFIDLAERKYGPEQGIPRDVAILEVIPIAKDYASSRKGKTVDPSYTSKSIFFMSHHLELLSGDAITVMQSFCLPHLLYKVYLSQMALNLADKLRLPNAGPDILAPEPTNQGDCAAEFEGVSGERVDDDEESEDKEMVPEEQRELNNNGQDAEEEEDDDEDEDEELDGEADDDYSSGDEEYDEQDYSTDASSDGDVAFEEQLKETLTKKTLSFNPERYKGPEKFDFSQYRAKNLSRFDCEYSESHAPERRLFENASKFQALADSMSVAETLSQEVIESMRGLRVSLMTDTPYMGEVIDLQHILRTVDHSIKPTLRFDRNTRPIKVAPRDLALIEALTQQRAEECYSLEGLENIGDSYLKYVTSVVLFKLLPDSDQGVLTSARSRLICNQNFHYLARKNSLGAYAITRSFDRVVMCNLLNGNTRVEPLKLRSKELADLFESLVGAHLVYGGEYEATKIIKTLGLDIFKEGVLKEWHQEAVQFSRCPSVLTVDANANSEATTHFNWLRDKIKGLEAILGYEFRDPSYLVSAMTHASLPNKCTHSYERLEFLGDAVLDFLVSTTLYQTGSFDDPGQMTTSRSQLVNNISFARLTIKFRLDLFILFANYEMYQQLTRLMQALEEDPELDLDMSEYDQIAKLLGDIFESIAGAVYLDSECSLDTVWDTFYPMMKETIDLEIKSPSKNKLMLLHETFPCGGRIQFNRKVNASGLHVVQCAIADYRSFEGQGASFRQAKIRAVEEALRNVPSAERLKNLNDKYLQDHPPVVRPPRAAGRGRGRGRGGGARGRGSQRGRGGGGGRFHRGAGMGRGASRGGAGGGGPRNFRRSDSRE